MNSERRNTIDRKSALRLLRVIAKGTGRVRQAAKAGCVVVEGAENRRCLISLSHLETLERSGLIRRKDDEILLAEPGKAVARSGKTACEVLDARHRDLAERETEFAGAPQTVKFNMAESPLAMLGRRKDRTGRRFLEDCQLLAGERLRADFTRGSMSPQLGVNWQAAASVGRSGSRGGIGELTDAALAARIRVEKAVEAVGPELSGVLLDACCFLKGMEIIEAERGWPPRSAKVVLKTALSALARHYGYSSLAISSRRSGRIVHWGDETYRPALDGRNNTA